MKLLNFIVVAMISLVVFSTSVYALQQTVGKVVIYTEVGGTNSSYYGLTNEGNETITVKLRSEGNISDFVDFPKVLELPPEKFVPVIINVSIPSNYDFSKGKTIIGYIFALLEGEPGQVKINIQTKKTVEIIVKENDYIPTENKASGLSDVTGLFLKPISVPFFGIVLIVFVFIGLFVLIKWKRR
jgi:hypothetical protein